MSGAEETRSIVVEEEVAHPPDKVWRALTDSRLIAQWLMPNDFRPVVGHRFTFQARPMGDWDGVVDCEVLEVKEPERLKYSWVGGAESNGRYGSRLDSVVTWTLTRTERGTRVRMEHEGFRAPHNDYAYDAMSGGWSRVFEAIERVIRAAA